MATGLPGFPGACVDVVAGDTVRRTYLARLIFSSSLLVVLHTKRPNLRVFLRIDLHATGMRRMRR
jgi:hypothetical protein